MGYSIPAAIGAKVARPDQPVVAVLGDGSFAMSLHALMTAVQERLPIGVVVFNNTALGWVLHGMGKRAVAATFEEADYAAIARSLGCDGVRPTTVGELQDALKHCANPGDRPFVVDVPISLATSFNDIEQFARIAD
jgi:acetolactate synthase-1/2/3 large subunit